jgi:hypothetical protein
MNVFPAGQAEYRDQTILRTAMASERFIRSYYGAERGGRSIQRPVGPVMTRDRHAIIDGDSMRIFSVQERRAVQKTMVKYPINTGHLPRRLPNSGGDDSRHGIAP